MECKSSQMVNITKASFGTLHLTPAKKTETFQYFQMFTQNWWTKLNFNFSEWFCHLPMRRLPKTQIQNGVSQLDSHSTLTNNKKTSWKASADFVRPNKLIRSLEARPHFRKLVYGALINDKVYIMEMSDDILKEVVTIDQLPYP